MVHKKTFNIKKEVMQEENRKKDTQKTNKTSKKSYRKHIKKGINPTYSAVTLNINELDTTIKGEGLAEQIVTKRQNHDIVIDYLQDTHVSFKVTS